MLTPLRKHGSYGENYMSATNTPAVPSAKLPKAVRMQAENANRILKEQVEKSFEANTPNGSQTVPTQDAPQTTPNVTTQTTPAPAQPPVVEEPKNVEPEKDAKYWEHRFKTSQGMYEADKARLRQENSSLKAEVSGLESRFKELEEKFKAVERQTPTKIDLKKYLTEEQIDTYGPDVLQAVLRTATQAAEEASERRIREEIDRHVGPVKQKLDHAEKESQNRREADFWDALEEKMPDWAIINDNPKFHEWLAQKDPFSGMTRQDLLSRSQMAFDPDRVVAMFAAFKQSSPAPRNPTAETQHRVVPDPVGQTAIVTSNTPDTKTYTRAFVARFYNDCALGRYKSRPQEREALDRDIRKAMAEGRIS